LTATLGQPPEGIEKRTVTSEPFKRFQRLGLIRRECSVLSSRRGRYTGLWRPLDRRALAAWLQANPPPEGEPAVVRQPVFPCMA